MKKSGALRNVIIIVLILGVIAAGVLYALGFFGGTTAASAPTYEIARLKTGDLQKSVKGTGTLGAGGTSDIKIPVALTIGEIQAATGESVKAGDILATVDKKSLDSTIYSLQAEIENLDRQLTRLLDAEVSTATVKSKAEGRVKKIIAKKGDDVKDIMAEYGGLLMLSTDGKMKVDIILETAGMVKLGYLVKVKTGSKSYTGKVAGVSGDKTSCTVTLTDYKTKLNAGAKVYYKGREIGSGKLEINEPVLITATGGTVKKMNIYLNKKIYVNSTLFYLKNMPYSENYKSLAEKRAEYAGQLQQALKIQKTGSINAEKDGIVNSIAAADGQEAASGDILLSLYTGGPTNLTVSVDELDIKDVKTGQKAVLEMDAITDKTFGGEITYISQLGTTSNGVTTYSVNIKVADAENLKIGMNATATIIVEEHKDVLLLPIDALQSTRGEQYVWLYTGSLPENGNEDPGKRVVVETGLSNDSYVEITSGLTAKDQVVIVRTQSTSSSSSSRRQNGSFQFPGMMEGGGQRMPQGGRPD